MNIVTAGEDFAPKKIARLHCEGCVKRGCERCNVQHGLAPRVIEVATTGELCTAMRRWSRSTPLHSEICTALAVMAAAIKQTGALGEKCKRSLIDQLDEMSAEVDQDYCNQRAEA